MIESDGSIHIFERDTQLEKIIDRKNAFHYITFESLGLFLDILNELIIDNNENKDRYSTGKLHDFLKLRRLRLENTNLNTEIFNNKEIDYIDRFRKYISNIRSTVLVKNFSKYELINHITRNIKNHALEYKNNPEALINAIREDLSTFKHLYYNINNKSGNIDLYIHNYLYCISLISNTTDFRLADQRWLTSLIVTSNVSDLLIKVKKSNNLDFIIYKNDSDDFCTVNIRTPLDWCIVKVDKILQNLKTDYEQEALKEKLLIARSKIKGLLTENPHYPIKIEHLHTEDIKRLRWKFLSILELVIDDYQLHKNIKKDLISITNLLSATHNKILNTLELEQKVSFSLSEIKKNNTLYIVSKNNKKNVNFSFGEENLTAILASNLRCLYKEHSHISINCEAMVGNGRSDVHLSMGNKTFGLIEAKLLKENSDIESETRNAIDQLYSRYSENENIEGGADISLYLILFSYDRDFRNLSKSIKNAIHTYSIRNSLDYEKISMTENGLRFIYKEPRNNLDFLDKTRTINIMVCNMEIDYRSMSKQRAANKLYNPSKST